MADIIQDSIYKSTIGWLNENVNKTIPVPNGKIKVTVGELASRFITKKVLESYQNNLFISNLRNTFDDLNSDTVKNEIYFFVVGNIKEESKKQGVDENNFSFDVDRREELFRINELQSMFITPNVSLQISKKVK